MPHVALITSSYPDGTPGSEAAGSFVADFARELSNHVRVTVLAASSADSETIEDQLTVRRFAVPRIPMSLLRPLNPLDWVAIVQTLFAGRAALESIASSDCPDHILALWALPGGYWADSVAQERSIPFSIWALGSDIWGLGKVPLVRTKLRSVLRRAEHRFADGLQLAADVQGICDRSCDFLPSTRQLPVPVENGVSTAAPYKLTFLGRWHMNKGIDLLLDALLQLGDSDWEKITEIRIHGGGPLAGAVGLAVDKLLKQDRPISLGGYLDKQQAADLIGWADYLLLPSRIESIPVIFSDAVQLLTPVVATPVGDLPRLYEKYQFGVVATTTDPREYANALRAALSRSADKFAPHLETAKSDFDLRTIVNDFLNQTMTLTS